MSAEKGTFEYGKLIEISTWSVSGAGPGAKGASVSTWFVALPPSVTLLPPAPSSRRMGNDGAPCVRAVRAQGPAGMGGGMRMRAGAPVAKGGADSRRRKRCTVACASGQLHMRRIRMTSGVRDTVAEFGNEE